MRLKSGILLILVFLILQAAVLFNAASQPPQNQSQHELTAKKNEGSTPPATIEPSWLSSTVEYYAGKLQSKYRLENKGQVYGVASLFLYVPTYFVLFLLHAYAIYSFNWVFFLLSGVTVLLAYTQIGKISIETWRLPKSLLFLQNTLEMSRSYYILISYALAMQFLTPKYSFHGKNQKLSQFPVLRAWNFSGPQRPTWMKQIFTATANLLMSIPPIRWILMDILGLKQSHMAFLVAYTSGITFGYVNIVFLPQYCFAATMVLYAFMTYCMLKELPESPEIPRKALYF